MKVSIFTAEKILCILHGHVCVHHADTTRANTHNIFVLNQTVRTKSTLFTAIDYYIYDTFCQRDSTLCDASSRP